MEAIARFLAAVALSVLLSVTAAAKSAIAAKSMETGVNTCPSKVGLIVRADNSRKAAVIAIPNL